MKRSLDALMLPSPVCPPSVFSSPLFPPDSRATVTDCLPLLSLPPLSADSVCVFFE